MIGPMLVVIIVFLAAVGMYAWPSFLPAFLGACAVLSYLVGILVGRKKQ